MLSKMKTVDEVGLYTSIYIQGDNVEVAISFLRILRSCWRERERSIFNGFLWSKNFDAEI